MGLVVVPKTRSMLSRFATSSLTWAIVNALGCIASVGALAVQVVMGNMLPAVTSAMVATACAMTASMLFADWQARR